MRHVIIGTAGHIDHGKSTLIRALTNIETDRLKEEKARGITIELGFAYFDLPSGRRAGIIDVPGHERFIKNMLAGAGGIDIVVLVIAADEGVMPQTKEHLQILSLLETQKGIVALTKADMVDPEWLELMIDDVAEQLSNTFLGEADIVPVSAVTGAGIQELIEKIDELTATVSPRDEHLSLRYPIDRIFTMTGFGTVVTGTIVAGKVSVGEKVEIFPQLLPARIRSLQVHGEKVNTAYAGQRVAMNLAGVQVDDLQRGNVLAAPGLLRPSLMLDVRLLMVKDSEKTLNNRERLRLYTGASEVLCRAILLDKENLAAGETGLVQLRLEEPLAVQTGDRFVVRTYSPLHTVGGGAILDAHPRKRRRFRPEGIKELELRESGGDLQILNQTLLSHSEELPTLEQLFKLAGRPNHDLAEALEALEEEDLVFHLVVDGVALYVHGDYLATLAQRARQEVERYHQRFPLRPGMAKEELRSRIAPKINTKQFTSLLTLLAADADLEIRGEFAAIQGWQITFSGEYEKIRAYLLAQLEENPYAPPSVIDMAATMGASIDKINEVVVALSRQEKIVRLSSELVFLVQTLAEVQELVVQSIQTNGSITLADLRSQLGTSRRYAMPLLEYLDDKKVTKRQGDVRVLHGQYV